MRQTCAPRTRQRRQLRNRRWLGRFAVLLAFALFVGAGCRAKLPTEKREASQPATSDEKAEGPLQHRGKELEVVSGLGLRLELEAKSFEGSSFRVRGIPEGYQVWAPITDGSFENYLVFDAESAHIASILVRYNPGRYAHVAPLERYRLHFEELPKFPVWEAQITADQAPAAGLVTKFTDGRFGYVVTTRGGERWLLDGWTFKSTEALRCAGAEMCPEYECVCGHNANGRPRIATGERLACVDARCVAPEPCDEFCLSIDFAEDPAAARDPCHP